MWISQHLVGVLHLSLLIGGRSVDLSAFGRGATPLITDWRV